MKRVATLFLTILCTCHFLSAQEINTDSLKNRLKEKMPDTSRVKLFIELSKAYREFDLDSALLFGEQAYTTATSAKFYPGQAKALNRIGLVYKDWGKLDTAILFFTKSVDAFRKTSDRQGEANGYNNLGLTWDNIGKPDSASHAYQKAIGLLESINDKTSVAYTYTNMAQSQRQHGNYLKAVDLYFTALAMYESLDTSEALQSKIASIYSALGTVYSNMEKYDEALPYYEKSLAIQTKIKNEFQVATTQQNLGGMYLQLHQLDLAEEYVQKSLIYFKALNYSKGIMVGIFNLGKIAQERENYEEARNHFSDILKQTRGQGNKEGEAYSLVYLAEVYLHENKIDKVIELCTQALKIADENNFPDPGREANRLLSESYIKRGDYRLGHTYFVKYVALRDSAFNENKLKQLYTLEKEYEVNRKQSEIDRLATQNQIKELSLRNEKTIRYFLIAGLIFIVILAGVIYKSYKTKLLLSKGLESQNQEIQRLNQVLEIRALRSQMDPHFVFNALNGLQHFLTVNTAEASIEYLSRVARLIRLTLQNASRDWVKLSEEIEILKLYLELEQYRFPGKFDFEFDIESSAANEKVPFLVIQPYLENAVLHGMIPRKENGGKILITAKRVDKTLRVTVEDNGVGRKTKAHSDTTHISMGSGLVRERLKKLSLQLNMLMEASIEDLEDENGNPSGTKSILIFELQPKEISLAIA